jgi:hypothetical protein
VNAAFMSFQARESGIHAVWPDAGEGSVTEVRFVATGTTVRHLAGAGAHRAPDGKAFTSDLSAQDFFRLLAAGAVPVAFVLGTCVYHIAHRSVLQSLRQAYQNQEMMQFTQGVFAGRSRSTRPADAPPLSGRTCRRRRPARPCPPARTARVPGRQARS